MQMILWVVDKVSGRFTDLENNTENKRSSSRWCFFIGGCDNIHLWNSRRHVKTFKADKMLAVPLKKK